MALGTAGEVAARLFCACLLVVFYLGIAVAAKDRVSRWERWGTRTFFLFMPTLACVLAQDACRLAK